MTLSLRIIDTAFRLSTILVFATAKSSTQTNSENDCDFYLAPSSIEGAGFGVFAGRDFKVGDQFGEPSQGIQVTDPFKIYENEVILPEFGWNSNSVGGDSEADTVFTLLPGLSMLMNFHQTLSNVMPGSLMEDSSLRREVHPGVGGSTSYNNFTFICSQDIAEGQELFGSIGDGWFSYHQELNPSLTFPSRDDFKSSDELISELSSFRTNNTELTDAQFLDILQRIKNEIFKNNRNIQEIFPSSEHAFNKAIKHGIARSLLKNRDINWLKEHGKCLDNIKSGPSTIVGAENGAFSKRFISKGSLVSPAPLVQILNKDNLSSYKKEMSINNKQLLINYCFGHRNSKLVLCPTTAVTLINHSKKRANVMFTWSKNSANSIVQPINWLKNENKTIRGFNTRLSFDFIALRDIQPGEEILADYGDEWELAWADHKKKWKPNIDTIKYVPSSELNRKNSPILLSDDPQMYHHSYLCRLEPFAREISLENIPLEDFRANPIILPEHWNSHSQMFYRDNNFIWWWPCDIIEINRKENKYKALVYKKYGEGDKKEIIRRFENMPRKAIKFVEKRYHSNQHLMNAFRHYIPIPDEIFPLQWRDDYVSAESLKLGHKDDGLDVTGKESLDSFLVKLEQAKCGVYVAPSNIFNAGLGTYVGITMQRKLPLGAKMPIFPVVDKVSARRWDADDYTWDASNYDAEYETDSSGTCSIQVVNEGCMANFHPGLVNFQTGTVTYLPLLDRRKDPGAGAFSDYINFSFESIHEVKAGEEVFISYGEHWFDERDYLGIIPLSEHYAEANEIVASLASFQKNDEKITLSDKALADLLGVVKTKAIKKEETRKVFTSINNVDDIRNVMSSNGTAETTVTLRSQEWLEEHGYCIDHMYSKRSTIDQAGQGAFARRHLSKDQIIIPAPLLNTWGRKEFNLGGYHIPDNVNTKQLIYNYQFAHPESSILFFPTNSAVLINHNSERMPNGSSPNAELRWSTSSKKSSYFLQRHLEDLQEEHYATMVLDIVATRDIQPGEEIFIDYGKDWEDAWNEHVHNFHSPCGNNDDCFSSSKVVASMNDDKFNERFHEWSDDHFTVCHKSFMPRNDESIFFLMPMDSDKTKYEKYGNTDTKFRGIYFNDEGFDLAFVNSNWSPCKILRGDARDGIFDVVYFTIETAADVNKKGSNVLRRTRTLPAESIWFRSKPYKSDMHWKNAFRHEIKIPDSIFPPHWRDLSQKSIEILI